MTALSTLLFVTLGSHRGLPSAPGQDRPVPKVTYETTGDSADRVLAELSVKLGIALEASPQTKGEVLAIRVANVPSRELLAKIAWVVGGSWKQEKGVRRLVRTTVDQREEENRERLRSVEQYRKILSVKRKEWEGYPTFNSATAETLAKEAAARVAQYNSESQSRRLSEFSQTLASRSPSGLALRRILLQFRPEDLADLPNDYKVAYSTSPTPTQNPFKFSLGPILSQLRAEHELWRLALEKYHVKGPVINGTAYALPGCEGADAPLERVGRVVLSVHRTGYGEGGINALMHVLDTRGKSIAKSSTSLWNETDLEEPQGPAVAGEAAVDASPELIAIYGSTPSNPFARPTLSPQMRARLLRPDQEEPLSYLAGTTLRNVAKVKLRNLVAVLGEDGWRAYTPTMRDTLPLPLLMKRISTFNEVQDGEGWLIIRPINASRNRLSRVDRSTMASYLKRWSSRNLPAFAECAAWAYRLPEYPYLLNELNYLLFNPQVPYGDPCLLRFYGSLSVDQQRQAQSGGLGAQSLSPEQTTLLKKVLYHPDTIMNLNSQKAPIYGFDEREFYNGVLKEPSEFLPNGLQSSSLLLIKEVKDVVAFLDPKLPGNRFRPLQGFTADELGFQKFALARPDLVPWANAPGQTTDFNQLRFGKRTTYSLSFKFTPYISYDQTITDHEYTTDNSMPYESLPADFRKAVDASIAEHLKTYQGVVRSMEPKPTNKVTCSPYMDPLEM